MESTEKDHDESEKSEKKAEKPREKNSVVNVSTTSFNEGESSCTDSFTHKVSDSGYANSSSNSNSQSQKSDSYKSSQKSNSSSYSSGYHGSHKKIKCSENQAPVDNVNDKDPKTKSTHANKEPDVDDQSTITNQPSTSNDNQTEATSTVTSEDSQIIPETSTRTDASIESSVDEKNLPDTKQSLTVSELEHIVSDGAKSTVKSDKVVCGPSPVHSYAHESTETGFCCLVSMVDGTIVYTTHGLTAVLGFRQDMWLGRSFIDFVHPDSKETFTTNVALAALTPATSAKIQDYKNTIYISLRQYHTIKLFGFEVTDKNRALYKPLQLTFKIRQFAEDSSECHANELYLMIYALPIVSVFSVPREIKTNPVKMCMRHSAAYDIVYIDVELITYLGYFPQHIVGKSILAFYHPQDLPYLKEVYRNVLEEAAKNGKNVFTSKPYRFLVQNGDYVTMKTDFNYFVNPWSRKIEYFNCYHTIIQGPQMPDVFNTDRKFNRPPTPEEVQKQREQLDSEIKELVKKKLPPRQSGKTIASHRVNLINFIESFTDEVAKNKLKVENPMLLGDISHYYDYFDSSKSSSETPPSYNQLNYNDNLERFFESKPATLHVSSDESSGNCGESEKTSDEGKKGVGQQTSETKYAPSNTGSGSGSNPFDNSSNSYCGNTSHDSYKAPKLTEALLMRHNEDMEKCMVKRHRLLKGKKARSGGKRIKKGARYGMKRSGGNSWKDDTRKRIKHLHHYRDKSVADANDHAGNKKIAQPALGPVESSEFHGSVVKSTDNGTKLTAQSSSISLSSHFTQTVTPTDTPTKHSSKTFSTGLYPITMVYPSSYSTEPRLYSLIPPIKTALPSNISTPTTTVIQTSMSAPTHSPNVNSTWESDQLCDGPSSSQATSIKVGIGSDLDLSESSKPDMNMLQSDSSLDAEKAEGGGVSSKVATPPVSVAEGSNNSSLPLGVSSSLRGESESDFFSSSCYSSFFKSERSSSLGNNSTKTKSEEIKSDTEWDKKLLSVGMKKPDVPKRKSTPPWMEDVNLTPDLIFKYQLVPKSTADVLRSDLIKLANTQQPAAVNEQLGQLYMDLHEEGKLSKLTLEEGITSSSGSSADESKKDNDMTKRKRTFSKLVMLHEENAPFPSPSDVY